MAMHPNALDRIRAEPEALHADMTPADICDVLKRLHFSVPPVTIKLDKDVRDYSGPRSYPARRTPAVTARRFPPPRSVEVGAQYGGGDPHRAENGRDAEKDGKPRQSRQRQRRWRVESQNVGGQRCEKKEPERTAA